MGPSRKAPPAAVVGIDIGSDSIKVAEAKFGKDGISITSLGIGRTPEGVVDNEVIVDPKALGAAIKALLTESGIKTKQSVSSVAGQSRVVVRVIEVPKMNPNELAETMKWEVERQVPFSPQDVVMDFQPLDKPNADPNAQEMEVLLAVAQDELVNSHVEALKAAGLKPMAIDIESLASSRAIIETSDNGFKNEIIGIVNIGNNNTDLGIFENGILTFPSPPISIAGISFTREIAEALGETVEQAETIKKEYASVNLNAFSAPAAAPAAPQQQTTGTPVDTSSDSEPTSFGTSVGPETEEEDESKPGFVFASAFDLDDDETPPAAAEPTTAEPADAVPPDNDGIAAEPADLSFLQSNTDKNESAPAGPAFDSGSQDVVSAGPAFDLGGTGEPTPITGPTFDSGAQQEGAPAAGPLFDFGDGEPAAQPAPASGPTFDLDGAPAEPAVAEESAPNFDLADTKADADPGPEAVVQPAAQVAYQPGSMEEKVFEAISGVLVDMANELRRSIEYYNNKYGQTPERLIICGGTAKMPHLDEFLSTELGVPVEVADPIKNLNLKVTSASDRYIKEISPLFAVSIGLAIRDMIG